MTQFLRRKRTNDTTRARSWLGGRSHRAAISGVMLIGFAGIGAASAQSDTDTAQNAERHNASNEARFEFGDFAHQIEHLNDPQSVALDANGLIYVPVAGEDRVVVLNREGEVSHQWGGTGSGEGQLNAPAGIAVHDDGRVFVSDQGNNRISVFSSQGEPRSQWGTFGRKNGQFNAPGDLCIHDNHVIVADVGNDRVQIFDTDGAFIRAIGERGHEPGQLNRPVDVNVVRAVVDGAMKSILVVVESENNRISTFDLNTGAHLAAWGDWGPHSGLLNNPLGVTSRHGAMYVADEQNHRIDVFNVHGKHVAQWGIHALQPRVGKGKLHYPNDVAISHDGRFAVICESFENRLQVIDARDPQKTQSGPPPFPSPDTTPHFGHYLDTDGQLLVFTQPELHRLDVFDLRRETPIHITSFGRRGWGLGQFIRTSGVEINEQTRTILVGDAATGRLQRFELDYDLDRPLRFAPFISRMVLAVELPAITSDVNWPPQPAAIESDAEGTFYVVDSRNHYLLVMDDDLRFQRRIGGYGGEPAQFRRPTDVAVGPEGEFLYVVDAHNHRVQKLTDAGAFVTEWGQAGETDGQFLDPFGIAVDEEGFVYVTDAARHNVQKFDSNGEFLNAWGGLGTDHNQFWKPMDITIDARGRLMISDYGNHRATMYSTNGTWMMTFGLGRSYTPENTDPGN